MEYIGISTGFHDASVSVINNKGDILFAGHSERYSKNKHDKELCLPLIYDAFKQVSDKFELHYYEKPWLKYLRQLRSGEKPALRTLSVNDSIGTAFLRVMNSQKVYTHGHHLSHAAAGFQTSTFADATVVIIDAIGEFDTISIWDARYIDGKATYKKLWGKKYPDSIGLFYSAMTKRVGLRPLDEEYILMGMAAHGKPTLVNAMRDILLDNDSNIDFKENLHIGVREDFLASADDMDIAASSQLLVEEMIRTVMLQANILGKSNNLVYGGGVALNCLANRHLGQYYDNIWIMPNPGDSGSSLGAAALGYQKPLNWINSYLGHDILGEYPVDTILQHLFNDKIVGVASGRAEFGPRALGNRSLLADPRGKDIKDKVNAIKRRQKFRPFAPVIMEEYANQYFRFPRNWDNSRYMQVVARCRNPDWFPAIVHVDGTSRVQTVPNDRSGIRKLLEKWYAQTKCPMLLNTSLNIRGEPMVNDRADADRFQDLYNIKVIS
jgi:carbamoyltransferase